jgi:hypothetical protein
MKTLMMTLILLLAACNQQLGLPGKDGVDGAAGAPGSNGINGRDGSVVTFVKFCPHTASYPTTFPEVGLCVDGELFAVYSANGGFGVKLEPGNYSSNAIGSACSFEVHDDCVVVPQ